MNWCIWRRISLAYLPLSIVTIMLAGMVACQPVKVELPFETIAYSWFGDGENDYPGEDPKLMVVAKADEVTAVEGLISFDAYNQLQKIDYKKYFSIVIFHGWRPTGGYGLEVQQIIREQDLITINVRFQEPGVVAPAVETSPYLVVIVEKVGDFGKEFQFVLNEDSVSTAKHFIPQK